MHTDPNAQHRRHRADPSQQPSAAAAEAPDRTTPDERLPDVSFAIPCYNEEEVLERTVRRLAHEFHRRGVRLELVTVDNGSTDGTSALIDRLIAEGLPLVKIRLEQNAGYGGGILCGLKACRAPWIGYLHADGQVEPEDVFRVYDTAVGAPRAALVQVNRRFRLDGLKRRIVTRIYNLLINTLFGGLGTSDVNGSPKLLRRDDFDRLDMQSTDWFFDAEMMIKAHWHRLPVIEVNVLSQARLGGTSHVDASARRQFLRNLIRWRFTRH